MLKILVLTVLLIVHLSLYPWVFQAHAHGGSPISALLNYGLRVTLRRMVFDASANILFYVPFGFAGYLCLRRRLAPAAAAALTLAAGAALSFSLELAQFFVPTRTTSSADLLANTLGGALGTLLAISVPRRAAWDRLDLARSSPARGAAAVLCFWVAWQLYPAIPITTLPWLAARLKALAGGASLSVAALSIHAAEWIAVWMLVCAASGGRRARAWFILLLLLVPTRILLANRTVAWSELAVLPPVFLLSLASRKPEARWFMAAALLLAAAVLAAGLTPLGSAPPGSFQWTPVYSLLAGSRDRIIPMLLRKAFRYGAMLWLLDAAGMPRALAAAAVVLVLAAIEAAQLVVPGHVPEITDPLLALVMALVLAAAGRPRPAAPLLTS